MREAPTSIKTVVETCIVGRRRQGRTKERVKGSKYICIAMVQSVTSERLLFHATRQYQYCPCQFLYTGVALLQQERKRPLTPYDFLASRKGGSQTAPTCPQITLLFRVPQRRRQP